jgi:23S rRNA (pseudouridine1915-N3)-methyltransferase
MSLIRFLFVGKNDDSEYARGIERYVERTSRFVKAEVVTVKEEKPGAKADPARILQAEAARIEKELQPRDFLVSCDEHGKERTSGELAQELRRWLDSSPRSVTFLVGGAFGIDPVLLRKSRAILPLSRLTLPHQLARVVLSEQVYRAVATLHGVAYAK